jgi:hypothetical protein
MRSAGAISEYNIAIGECDNRLGTRSAFLDSLKGVSG